MLSHMTRPRVSIAFLAILAAILMVLWGSGGVVRAASFTVTKTGDTNDGTCDADCSLREAINAANVLAGADTILLPAGTYTLTIAGAGEDANATGDLDITDDLTINGAGQVTTIIDGNATDRVFHVLSSGTVEINGVTIQNGNVSGGFPAGLGGGIFNDGGTLTLTDSTISDNTATNAGGIFNYGGTLTLNSSTVSGNTATSANTATNAGGIGNFGFGTLTLNSSTVSDNMASNGAGFSLSRGSTVTLTNSTVSGNTAETFGGGFSSSGIQIFGDPPAATASTVTLTNSTVSGNTARYGGGFASRGAVTLILTNSTVSGNTAEIFGGGFYFTSGESGKGSGTLTLNSSTVSDNRTNTTGNNVGGGIRLASNTNAVTPATLKNTIVANNVNGDCVDFGIFTSLGNNLDSDGTCDLAIANDDIPNGNANLGLLALNSPGTTETHALLAGSDAIDAGSVDCPPPATDQRGVSRPQGLACDIGAFELLVVAAAPKLTVTKVVVNDDGGTKVVPDFPLFVDGSPVTSGVENTFGTGAHTVSETEDVGYAATIGGDCATDGSITLALGDVKSCTITNTGLLDTDGDGIPNIIDPDDDGDGIEDIIDTQPLVASTQFDDTLVGGKTPGRIVSLQSGVSVVITDALPNPSQGVTVVVSGTPGNKAKIKIDGSKGVHKLVAPGTYVLSDPETTVTTQVVSGEAEIEFDSFSPLVLVVVGTGETVTITETFVDGILQSITVVAVTGTITVNGVEVTAGNSLTLTVVAFHPFAAFDVSQAKLKLGSGADDDKFEVEGTFTLGGLTRIHRKTTLGTVLEEARGCSSESGIMVLEQKTAWKQGAPNRCCHRTIPTGSASSLMTTAWWPMPACSCRPPSPSTWA